MQILELAAQGVRGFSPSSRAELPRGYCVLVPPSREPVPLRALMLALLFPDGAGDKALLAQGCELGNASLMFRASDGAAYYLARELGGASALHRANETSGQWELLAEEASKVSEYLRSKVGLPSKKHFDHAFTLLAGHFPSRRPAVKAASVESADLKPADPQSSARAPDVAAAKAKLGELTLELEISVQLERWQFELDGVIAEMSEVESRMARVAQVESALAEAEAAFAGAASAQLLNLPEDIAERAGRYAKLVAKRDEALAKLDSDGGEQPGFVEPLKGNVRFWAAGAVGAALLAAGLFLHGPVRYVSLLDIPAFGLAALMALRYVDDVQRAEARSRKGERRAAREKKISDDFEAEAQWVKKALAALKLESPGEIAEALGKKAQLGQAVEELRHQLGALRGDPEYAAAIAREKTLKREREAIEAKMAEKGGYAREASEVRREVDRIKKSIDGAQASPPAARSPSSGAAAEPPAIDDPFAPLLGLAAELLRVDAATAGTLVGSRATQYFGPLTDRRYAGVEIDRTGKVWVLRPGQKLPARELPSKDLDLLYLSARLALVGQCAGRAQVPIVVEDVAALLDPGKLAVLGGILKRLGAAAQVLHLCSDRAVQALADATATL